MASQKEELELERTPSQPPDLRRRLVTPNNREDEPELPPTPVSSIIVRSRSHSSSSSSSLPSLNPSPPPLNIRLYSKYLHGVAALAVNKDPSTTHASRKFLSKTYGGGGEEFKVDFSRAHLKDPQDPQNPQVPSPVVNQTAMYPQLKHNPLLPVEPGAPGLMYTGRTDLTGFTFCLFVPLRPDSQAKPKKPKAMWDYFGNYRGSMVGWLTPAEFQELHPKVTELYWTLSVR